MKPYAKPVLRELGRMDVVTRKTGVEDDIGSEFTGSNLTPLQQILCAIWPGWDWCILDE